MRGDGYAKSQKNRLEREKGPTRKNWMTSTELAKHLGVSNRTFRRMQVRKDVPEPEKRTVSGWGLWSPDQIRSIVKKRAAL